MAKPKRNMIRWIAYYPESLLDRIDLWARQNGIDHRADAARQLLRAALDAEDAKGGTLPPDALAYLEAYRRETGARTVVDALAGLVRAHRAAERNLDNGQRPALRIVPPVSDLPAAPPTQVEPIGFLSRTWCALKGG